MVKHITLTMSVNFDGEKNAAQKFIKELIRKLEKFDDDEDYGIISCGANDLLKVEEENTDTIITGLISALYLDGDDIKAIVGNQKILVKRSSNIDYLNKLAEKIGGNWLKITPVMYVEPCELYDIYVNRIGAGYVVCVTVDACDLTIYKSQNPSLAFDKKEEIEKALAEVRVKD